jgi:hypothetical protein
MDLCKRSGDNTNEIGLTGLSLSLSLSDMKEPEIGILLAPARIYAQPGLIGTEFRVALEKPTIAISSVLAPLR